VSADVSETLGREAQDRPRAGIAAILAGVFAIVGGIILQLVTGNGPGIEEYRGVLDALDARVDGRPLGDTLFVQQTDYLGDNVVPLLLATLLTALSVALAAYALVYLFQAVRARAPAVGRGTLIAIVSAGVLFPVGFLVGRGAAFVGAIGFDDDQDRTAAAARDILQSPTVLAGQLLEILGGLALALAFALTSLNAMRVGLLTRFLGILGVVVAALSVIQIDAPQIVRSLWLVALGLLILGVGPFRNRPPAWAAGTAVPWPSQQELREQRDAARGGGGGGSRAKEPAPAPAPAAEVPASGEAVAASGAATKRKRKRRR